MIDDFRFFRIQFNVYQRQDERKEWNTCDGSDLKVYASTFSRKEKTLHTIHWSLSFSKRCEWVYLERKSEQIINFVGVSFTNSSDWTGYANWNTIWYLIYLSVIFTSFFFHLILHTISLEIWWRVEKKRMKKETEKEEMEADKKKKQHSGQIERKICKCRWK